MTKPSKLYEQLLTSPNSRISFRDFLRLLEAFGFAHMRTKGSHLSFKHPDVPHVLTVQPRGKEAVDYQVRRMLEFVEAYDLHMDA